MKDFENRLNKYAKWLRNEDRGQYLSPVDCTSDELKEYKKVIGNYFGLPDTWDKPHSNILSSGFCRCVNNTHRKS